MKNFFFLFFRLKMKSLVKERVWKCKSLVKKRVWKCKSLVKKRVWMFKSLVKKRVWKCKKFGQKANLEVQKFGPGATLEEWKFGQEVSLEIKKTIFFLVFWFFSAFLFLSQSLQNIFVFTFLLNMQSMVKKWTWTQELTKVWSRSKFWSERNSKKWI